jgi:hypothetical protein
MFKASVLFALAAALVLALISHTTGSFGAFKAALVACSYLAICALARLGGIIEPK